MDRLWVVIRVIPMDRVVDERMASKETEAIDDYFECTAFCSVEESMSDCETICMERFLKGHYF